MLNVDYGSSHDSIEAEARRVGGEGCGPRFRVAAPAESLSGRTNETDIPPKFLRSNAKLAAAGCVTRPEVTFLLGLISAKSKQSPAPTPLKENAKRGTCFVGSHSISQLNQDYKLKGIS